MGDCQGLGGMVNEKWLFNKCEISFRIMKIFWNQIVVMPNTMNILNVTKLYDSVQFSR